MDEAEIRRHLANDARLGKIMARIALPPPQGTGDVYHALLRSILYQQLSTQAATTIYNRFLALFRSGYPDAASLLQLEPETLRAAGLSRQKATYVKAVATFFQENPADETPWNQMDDESIIQHLIHIKGVGRWTVQMILMSTLNRPDVFPAEDLGIRQAMVGLYRLQEEGKTLKARLESIAQKWRPYRTYACYFLWRWKDAN